jgi:hypothetical protein
MVSLCGLELDSSVFECSGITYVDEEVGGPSRSLDRNLIEFSV